MKGHTKAVMDVDFDFKGGLLGEYDLYTKVALAHGVRHIVSCSNDMSLKIWDTNNEYKNTKTLHGHDHTVSAVKFLPGGDFLMSASRDKTIRIWEVATG